MPWFESLPDGLPDGRLVVPDDGTVPAYWISTRPTSAVAWHAWRERHPATGLWPLLIPNEGGADDPLALQADEAPNFSSPSEQAAEVLAEWFRYLVEEDVVDEDVDFDYLEPFGPTWPGVSPALPLGGPPDRFADRFATQMIADPPVPGPVHLGLVPAADGAEALTALGWIGPFNHENDTGLIAHVVRDWQQRFGVRVVGLGNDTLHLSVAAAPTTSDQALRVAMEHFAFCPDNIEQGAFDSIPAYAGAITGAHAWSFWWD